MKKFVSTWFSSFFDHNPLPVRDVNKRSIRQAVPPPVRTIQTHTIRERFIEHNVVHRVSVQTRQRLLYGYHGAFKSEGYGKTAPHIYYPV